MKICGNCGTKGKPKTHTRGYFILEILLWLFFLAPGALYTVWRFSTRTKVCPKCGAPNMVPLDSPNGKKLADEQLSIK